MSYSIDMIENGYVVTKSDISQGWSIEPARWAFLNWEDTISFLNSNKIFKEEKKDIVA